MGDSSTAMTDMQCHGAPYPEGLAYLRTVFFSGFLGFSANFLDKEGDFNLTTSTQNYILHRGCWCMGGGDMDGCLSRPCSNYCQHCTVYSSIQSHHP